MAATTYIVKKGDTLSEIAWKYSKENNYVLGTNSVTATNKLASINGIAKKDQGTLVVGQVLNLQPTPVAYGGSSSSRVSIKTKLGPFTDDPRTLFVSWDFSAHAQVEDYQVQWDYTTAILDKLGQWIQNARSTGVKVKQDTYTAPAAATRVRFRVIPVSKEKKSGAVYFSGDWCSWQYYKFTDEDETEDSGPVKPTAAPTVEIKNNKLTASVDNLDDKITQIEFQVRQDSKKLYNTGTANKVVSVLYTAASFTCTVADGHEYAVRCRSVSGSEKSEWTDFSSNVGTKPVKSTGITECKAVSGTSVSLAWDSVSNADKYDIEYATKKEYFDVTNQTTTVQTTTSTNKWTITGLESGSEYLFRVRAVNEHGQSDWTSIKSVVLGTTPAAPTTWSSTSTGTVGEPVTLHWVHNSEDGSSQTAALIELKIVEDTANGQVVKHQESITLDTSEEEDDEKTMRYVLNTTSDLYKEGVTLLWRVRTAGVTKTLGDWSIERSIDIYAPPTVDLSLTNVNGEDITVAETFPLYVNAITGPQTQNVVGYHISVIANNTYETVDNLGNPKTVNAGDEVYSKYFDIDTELVIMLSANNINLDNGVSYTVECTASMDSGLTAMASVDFTVSWTDMECIPNAEIEFDKRILATYIRPYCEDYSFSDAEQTFTLPSFKSYIAGLSGQSAYRYTVSIVTNTTYNVNVSEVGTVTMNSGDMVYSDYFESIEEMQDAFSGSVSGIIASGDYTVTLTTTTLISTIMDDVTLSVYRREFDGTFTELATGIDNHSNTFVTDPHPALDYARYRIIATMGSTGAISYYDIPGVPVEEKAVILQWDEKWSAFNTYNDEKVGEPPWAGSMLKLPYNIDVSDNYDPDYSLIEYIGREHPVSYYGTQKGTSATWSVEIDKEDKETLYALRRLAIWMGDVYVREPSGSGYWANVNVSFSQTHCELTIPVTLSITRVEGGV